VCLLHDDPISHSLPCAFHRFKIPTLSNGLAESRSTLLIHKLHEILHQFLLRRLKVDVERTLPPKKEYVFYAPLRNASAKCTMLSSRVASVDCWPA
jgi:SNF2-related domain